MFLIDGIDKIGGPRVSSRIVQCTAMVFRQTTNELEQKQRDCAAVGPDKSNF